MLNILCRFGKIMPGNQHFACFVFKKLLCAGQPASVNVDLF